MLNINFIRENPDIVKKASLDKLMPVDLDRLLELDESLRKLIAANESLRTERNHISKNIPKCSDIAEKEKLSARVREIKNELAQLESSEHNLRSEFDDLMLRVPSVPAPEVPFGKGEEDNVELRQVGQIKNFDFPFLDHVTICEKYDMIDFPRGVKVSGSRSYFLKNESVLLEMAVCRFALDFLVSKGFTPFSVPQLVKEKAMRGTGYFPIGYDQAYKLPEDELYLIGTSEVPLVSYHQDDILDLSVLPLRYAGFSSCYRREAGTYGKDTRGLYRVHQFQKVEQVIFCEADEKKAEELHYEILSNTEAILQALELPYRVCLACTGEIGIGQIRKHEIETWMPSRNAYCETHSCSSLGDFQSRRSNIRYRNSNDKMQYVFTLNNTGIASPRILIPLLENHQNADGTVTIPKNLRPYMGNREKIGKP